MSTNYPSSLDNFINPTPSDSLNSGIVPHAQQHANLNDAVEAIQTIIGVNPAGPHLTVKDRIIAAENDINTYSTLNGLENVTISSVSNGDVLQYNGSIWVNAEKKDLVDGGNF